MISDFHLKGYRGFQDFELENFSRVNVFVGKNNAGKSSLLEAMYLNATSIDMSVIQNIALRRGEVAYDGRSRVRKEVSGLSFSSRISIILMQCAALFLSTFAGPLYRTIRLKKAM